MKKLTKTELWLRNKNLKELYSKRDALKFQIEKEIAFNGVKGNEVLENLIAEHNKVIKAIWHFEGKRA